MRLWIRSSLLCFAGVVMLVGCVGTVSRPAGGWHRYDQATETNTVVLTGQYSKNHGLGSEALFVTNVGALDVFIADLRVTDRTIYLPPGEHQVAMYYHRNWSRAHATVSFTGTAQGQYRVVAHRVEGTARVEFWIEDSRSGEHVSATITSELKDTGNRPVPIVIPVY